MAKSVRDEGLLREAFEGAPPELGMGNFHRLLMRVQHGESDSSCDDFPLLSAQEA